MSNYTLPNEWEIHRLDKIASVDRGKFSARPRNDPKYYGGHIPFLQTGDVSSSNGIVTSYSQTLNEDGLRVSRLFDKGTLLITIAANIGDVAEVSFDFACPDSLVAVVPKNKILKEWLKYFLITKKQYFRSRATQNAQANINLETIRPIKVSLPPLPEQKAIADLLSTWDKAIEKTERLIQAKEKQFKWLLRELISEPRNTRNNTEWKKVKLGEICKIRTGKLDANAMVKGGQYRFYTCAKNYYQIDQYAFDTEALIVSGNGANVGYIHYYKGQFNAYQRTYVLDGFSDFISIQYLKKYLERTLAKRIHQEKSDSNTPYIRLSALSMMNIYLPTIETQKQIASTLSTAQQEIDLLKQLAEKYKTQKRGLMQRLLTGDWRIKPDVVREYE